MLVTLCLRCLCFRWLVHKLRLLYCLLAVALLICCRVVAALLGSCLFDLVVGSLVVVDDLDLLFT